jgi:hypothetical protein
MGGKSERYTAQEKAEIVLLRAREVICSHFCTIPAHVPLTTLKKISVLLLQTLDIRLQILHAVYSAVSNCVCNRRDNNLNV